MPCAGYEEMQPRGVELRRVDHPLALNKEDHIRFGGMLQYPVRAVKMVKRNEENPGFAGFTSHHDNDHYRTSRSPNRAPTFCATQKDDHIGDNPWVDDRFWSERCVAYR